MYLFQHGIFIGRLLQNKEGFWIKFQGHEAKGINRQNILEQLRKHIEIKDASESNKPYVYTDGLKVYFSD